MAKRIRTVGEFMSAASQSIAPQEPLIAARRQMDRQGIRHLPIVENGRPIGILTARDLYALTSVHEVDFCRSSVGFAMHRDPYCVQAKAPLDAVARELHRRCISSALVVDENEKLIGILTEADCVKALAAGA